MAAFASASQRGLWFVSLLALLAVTACSGQMQSEPTGPEPVKGPDRTAAPPVDTVVKDVPPAGLRLVYPVAYRFHTGAPEVPANGKTVNGSGYYVPIDGPHTDVGWPTNIGAVIKCKYDDLDVWPVRYEISWREGNSPGPGIPTDGKPLWINVTHKVPTWDMNPQDGIDLDGVCSFNYAFAFEYHIRARVTFSDGVVVQSRPEDEPVINVLPGPGWLPPYERKFYTDCWIREDGQYTGRRFNGGTFHNSPSTTIGIRIYAETFPFDDPAQSRYYIKWGEGEGWQDVTEKAQYWNTGPGDGPVSDANLITHTFTREGVYEVRTQVIYWDGEVIGNRESRTGYIHVHVDPPGTAPAPGI